MTSSKTIEVTHSEEASPRRARASLGPDAQDSLTKILRRRPIRPWGRGSLRLYAICLLVYLCSTMNGQAPRTILYPAQAC